MEVEVEVVEATYGFIPAAGGRRHQSYGHPHHLPAGDDEWWEYFPCPFCYIEVEVPFLCNHLQEEHCFDIKNAVCPMCADNLGKDMASHFRIQHPNLLKVLLRRKSSKPSPAADKEAYEVNSYFELPPYCIGRPVPDSTPDPLLSQFICSTFPINSRYGELEEGTDSSPISDDQRLNQSVMDDVSTEELEERLQRIEFVKQMLMTTIV